MRAALLIVTACIRLPHIDPQPRTLSEMERAAVRVDMTCGEADPFWNGDLSQSRDGIEWSQPAWGTGVVISERHVLTAAHVVACPVLPVIHVTLRDGRVFRMGEDREQGDVARLELASADTFGIHIAPPVIASATGDVVAIVIRPWPVPHGYAAGSLVVDMHVQPGDSGSGVYNSAGELVGLVSADVRSVAGQSIATRIVPISPSFLEGT